MSLSILDTDTLTLLQWDRMAIIDRLLAAAPDDIGVAIISVQEQFTGWLAAVNRVKGDAELARAYQRLTDNVRVLSGMRLLTFSEAAIRRYNGLVALKLNIGRMDLRIAAIALEEGATVVTMNLRDFGRVPGLTCENWIGE